MIHGLTIEPYVLLHACGRCLGVCPAPADHRAGEAAERKRHFRAFATTAMPLSTSAPSMTNGHSRANSSIGSPPAGIITSAPAAISGRDLLHELGADAARSLFHR